MNDARRNGAALAPTEEEAAELVATRRDLHAHPELAYQETRTARVVAERLRALGYEPRGEVGRTGVTALLEGEAPGRCVLLRADMDALPIQEANEVPYRSAAPKTMHACGHDAHTAILLAAARILRRLERPARGAVKLMFQPAEEGGNGALAMIEDGVLESPRVDAAFGLHVWNHLDAGKVAVVDGPFMAAVDRFSIRVVGRGGHGAVPHTARDPVLAAAHVVTAIQQVVARNVDPLKAAVVTVGSIRGGDAFNVIPPDVRLDGTMRSFDADVWASLPEHLERAATRTAEAFDCRAEVTVERMQKPTVNDPAMAALVREVAADVVGAENVVEGRTMGGEDFSEILLRVPGCYFFLGTRNERAGKTHPHHSPHFDVDEDALPVGARLLVAIAQRYLARS
jgi:amidohydrolase